MDEPFGSVDAQTREDLEDLVLRVRQERGITILLVTHDIDESVYVGDRVIVLTPGPGRVRAELAVNLPAPRDQITTKELPDFVRLRTEASRLVRGRPDPANPAASSPAAEAGSPAQQSGRQSYAASTALRSPSDFGLPVRLFHGSSSAPFTRRTSSCICVTIRPVVR